MLKDNILGFNNKMDVKWFETDLINFDNTVYKVVEYLESK